jgi:hypothetical protein
MWKLKFVAKIEIKFESTRETQEFYPISYDSGPAGQSQVIS